jgi:hypothetical protein
MPYTRAYQLPSPFAADDQPNAEIPLDAGDQPNAEIPLDAEETPTRLKTMLNITPSSNWIQETFYARDIVVEEVDVEEVDVEEVDVEGVTTTTEFLIIEKSKKLSLYQRFSDMQIRSKLFKVIAVASNLVPNADTVKKFIEEANGDDSRLAELKTGWEMEIIKAVTEGDFSEFIDKITEEKIYLRASFFRASGLESIRLTISSPKLPTRGDTPITAILYSPLDGDKVDGGIRGDSGQMVTAAGGPILFTWTDRSGFLSTMVILPNTIYEIQPVSIELGYEITLLA